MLHFFFLDLFADETAFTAEELTDRILSDYHVLFETQLIRKKAGEYVREGILISRREGKRLLYSMAPDPLRAASEILPALLNAVRLFHRCMPLCFIFRSILYCRKTYKRIFMV